MECFRDGGHVRLRSRQYGSYLYADEDGVGVSLRADRASLNTAWAVHVLRRHGGDYLFLLSAAYSGYLGVSSQESGPQQGMYYGDLRQGDVVWEASRPWDGSEDVFLRNIAFGAWYGSACGNFMLWMVEPIPARAAPPLLPASAEPPEEFARQVVCVSGDDDGRLDFEGARAIAFVGLSVFELRQELAGALGEYHPQRIVLCVWAGLQGRLTPLVTDLPRNNEELVIAVFDSWTAAARSLVYPDVDA